MSKVVAAKIRPMTLSDIEPVIKIDRQSFSMPWSEQLYRSELSNNPAAYLFVIEAGEELQEVVGFLGFWFIVDEAHISTFAIDPAFRRKGLGRRLLKFALARAASLGAELASLEVRLSNRSAVKLYEEFGFTITGRRKGYYQDNGEDALFMVLKDIKPSRIDMREGKSES